MLPRREAVEESLQIGAPAPAIGRSRAGAVDRLPEAIGGYRLEQVVERTDFERPESMFVIRCHEHHRGHRLGANGLDHIESCAVRHLDVEQHEVRAKGANGISRALSIFGLTNDRDATIGVQHAAQSHPGGRLVIDQQHAKLRHRP